MTRGLLTPARRRAVRQLIRLSPLVPLVTIVVAAAVSPPQLLAVMLAPGSLLVAWFPLILLAVVLWGGAAIVLRRVRLIDGAVAAAGTALMFVLTLMTLEAQPVVSVVLVMSLVVLAARGALALFDSLHGGTPSAGPAEATS